jgi:hypothetical protein
MSAQIDKMQRDIAIGAQKNDIIHRMCEENDQKVKDMQNRLQEYIESKVAKRKEAWTVQYGEEAKIETDSSIESMIFLSNKMIAVASH